MSWWRTKFLLKFPSLIFYWQVIEYIRKVVYKIPVLLLSSKLCSLLYLYMYFLLFDLFVLKTGPNLPFLSMSHSLLSKCTSDPGNSRHFICSSPIYTAWNGNFSFPISISADLAPVAVLFVYTLHPSGEIVADSVRFQIDKCFKHKVMFLLFLAWKVGSLLPAVFSSDYYHRQVGNSHSVLA